MEKYLYFRTGSGDSITFPLSRLIELEMDGSGTALDVRFLAPTDADDGVGEYDITLTIDDNFGKEVMTAIADEIRYGKNPFIVICDDVDSEFIHDEVESCGSLTAVVKA